MNLLKALLVAAGFLPAALISATLSDYKDIDGAEYIDSALCRIVDDDKVYSCVWFSIHGKNYVAVVHESSDFNEVVKLYYHENEKDNGKEIEPESIL